MEKQIAKQQKKSKEGRTTKRKLYKDERSRLNFHKVMGKKLDKIT